MDNLKQAVSAIEGKKTRTKVSIVRELYHVIIETQRKGYTLDMIFGVIQAEIPKLNKNTFKSGLYDYRGSSQKSVYLPKENSQTAETEADFHPEVTRKVTDSVVEPEINAPQPMTPVQRTNQSKNKLRNIKREG